MLARRIAAGPSRALLTRLASTAAAEVQHAQHQPPSPSPPPSSSAPSSPRVKLRAPRFTASPEKLERLVALVEQGTETALERRQTFELFDNLTAAQKLSLPTAQLRAILRAVVPRSGDVRRIANAGPKRELFAMNRKRSKQWEPRLRSILSILIARNDASVGDWLFTLHSLASLGDVKGCEAVVSEMPEDLRNHRAVSQYRLGAVVQWTRKMNFEPSRHPKTGLVDLAHDAFWDIFRGIQRDEMGVRGITLHLLLTATSEMTGLLVKLENPAAIERFDDFMRFLLKEGYGIDLGNIAASLLSRDPARPYGTLSAQGLNAVLKQLATRGTDPYSLLRAYELLSTDTRAGEVLETTNAYGNEDEDDFVPGISGLTAAEEAGDGLQKRDYFGGLGATASFFSPSAPEVPELAEGETVPQYRRHVPNFFPQSTSPRDITPDTSGTLPPKPRYDANSVLVLLEAIRASGNWTLFEGVLKTSVVDAQRANAEWLAAYLACPLESRKQLFRPMRVSPEWFRAALAYSNNEYGRGAGRLAGSIQYALEWIDQEIDVVIATEARLAKDAATTASVDDAGRTVLPVPDFATDPRAKQRAVNREVFIVSDALETLYNDRDELRHHLARALQLRGKRKEREAARQTRAVAKRALKAAQAAKEEARLAAQERASLMASANNDLAFIGAAGVSK